MSSWNAFEVISLIASSRSVVVELTRDNFDHILSKYVFDPLIFFKIKEKYCDPFQNFKDKIVA